MTTLPALVPTHPDWVDPAVAALLGLTSREVEVLCGIARGRTNAQIGAELYLAEDTVKTHVGRLFRKLGAGDRPNAVALAYDAELLRNAAARAAEEARRAAARPVPLPGQTTIDAILGPTPARRRPA